MWPMSAPSWLLLCSLLCPFSHGETILLFRALCASLVLAWDQPALPGALDALCKRHVITKTSDQVQMNLWLLFPFLLFTGLLAQSCFCACIWCISATLFPYFHYNTSSYSLLSCKPPYSPRFFQWEDTKITALRSSRAVKTSASQFSYVLLQGQSLLPAVSLPSLFAHLPCLAITQNCFIFIIKHHSQHKYTGKKI